MRPARVRARMEAGEGRPEGMATLPDGVGLLDADRLPLQAARSKLSTATSSNRRKNVGGLCSKRPAPTIGFDGSWRSKEV
jgi:hypothetical protein